MENVSNLNDKTGNSIVLTWVLAEENVADDFKPFFQVYGVCYDDAGRILIIQEKGKWKIPGGSPEKEETWKETLIREVWEEATVKIDNIELLGAQKVNYPHNPNAQEGDLYYQLRCIAHVESMAEPVPDPDTNIMIVREMVEPEEVFKRINWGNAGNAMFCDAFEKIENISLLPVK